MRRTTGGDDSGSDRSDFDEEVADYEDAGYVRVAGRPRVIPAKRDELRTVDGRLLAYIKRDKKGIDRLYSRKGIFAGSYDPRTHKTRDASGRVVGIGRWLPALVMQLGLI